MPQYTLVKIKLVGKSMRIIGLDFTIILKHAERWEEKAEAMKESSSSYQGTSL